MLDARAALLFGLGAGLCGPVMAGCNDPAIPPAQDLAAPELPALDLGSADPPAQGGDLSGRMCSRQADCPGQICCCSAPGCDEAVCTTLPPNAGICLTPEYNQGDMGCLPEGAPCNRPADCCDGTCLNNYCYLGP